MTSAVWLVMMSKNTFMPLGVGRVDEGLHVGVGAEVGVDLREVGDPVAVVAGALLAGTALDRLVLEARRQPDRRGAHVLDVVEPLGDALEVTTVVEALVGRVEPRGQRAAREAADVVGRRPVREAVGHDEVEALAGEWRAQRVRGQPPVGGHRVLVDDGCERHEVRLVVVGERDLRRAGQQQRDVCPVELSTRPVVLGPGVVERDLETRRCRPARRRSPGRARCHRRGTARCRCRRDPSHPGSRARSGGSPRGRPTRSSAAAGEAATTAGAATSAAPTATAYRRRGPGIVAPRVVRATDAVARRGLRG